MADESKICIPIDGSLVFIAALVGIGIGLLAAWMFFNPAPLPKPVAAIETALRVVRDEKGNILEILPAAP